MATESNLEALLALDCSTIIGENWISDTVSSNTTVGEGKQGDETLD
jgi:hypothetical protein